MNRIIYSPNRDDFENPDEIADFIINFEDSLMLSRFEPDSENIQFDILRLDMDGCFPADLGETFCAGIRNPATGWFVTAQEQNITGLPEAHSASQIWEFTRQADGSYQICNSFTKQCMEVQDFAVQGVDSNIFPGEYTGTTAQHYYIYSDDGVYYLKPVCSELYVDMAQDTGNLAVWTRRPQWQPQQFDLQIFPDGDINLDGAVTILDVIMLQKWLLQTGDLTYWKNADVHKDQQIDIFDLVTLKYQLIHSVNE
ncbi:MAG: RICIN domain-containing protein [Oscillospiraceae bacterium]|nr:RICIN domain-containing protein [Oscillospiraceae bacterium]